MQYVLIHFYRDGAIMIQDLMYTSTADAKYIETDYIARMFTILVQIRTLRIS